MRDAIRNALEHAAELTRKDRLVDALSVGEAAINQATDSERPEIKQWLADHANDFTGQGN
ncbi:hypothetical protein [Streptomyces sp. CT34]|uniref:hypothetical protein n=1 Tax=Streptomyces sp. CT34 TaxID=1553907 RepID=UPI0005BAD8E5|nr:hypothetical protein [Streptomyces sp. CT34]